MAVIFLFWNHVLRGLRLFPRKQRHRAREANLHQRTTREEVRESLQEPEDTRDTIGEYRSKESRDDTQELVEEGTVRSEGKDVLVSVDKFMVCEKIQGFRAYMTLAMTNAIAQMPTTMLIHTIQPNFVLSLICGLLGLKLKVKNTRH